VEIEMSNEKNIAHQREMFEREEQKRVLKLIAEKAANDRTLRNQFAAAALSGFLASNETDYLIAIQSSFECADRMLAESKK